MGNLFSRKNRTTLIEGQVDDEHNDVDKYEEFFDCLNNSNDDNDASEITHEKTESHYYAVWIPSNVEKMEFIFDNMKSAFALCKKYSKYNSRVKVFLSQNDAENFIRVNEEDMSSSLTINNINQNLNASKTNNDAEKLPYNDVPTSELAKLRVIGEKGHADELHRLAWSNPRYLISSGDSPTIIKVSTRYNILHIAALSGQAIIIRTTIKIIKDVNFIKKLYINDSNEQIQARLEYIVDMYLNTPDKMQNETPLHLASKFGHYEAIRVLLDESQCLKTSLNKSGQTPEKIVCSRCKDTSNIKKIVDLFQTMFYVPIYRRRVSMEKELSKPIDEITFKSVILLNQPLSVSHDVDDRRDLVLTAYAGPTTYEMATKFYQSVYSSTHGQSRRKQNITSSPKSPVNILRSDGEKGLERIARSCAIEEYDIDWNEYWSFLDMYTNLSTEDGLTLLNYYLLQRMLYTQIIETIEQCQKLSIRYTNNGGDSDSILTCITELSQTLYSLIGILELNERDDCRMILSKKYKTHLEFGFNEELEQVRLNLISKLKYLSDNRYQLLSKPFLSRLTMIFGFLISVSGCILIDNINEKQQKLNGTQKRLSISYLNILTTICPQVHRTLLDYQRTKLPKMGRQRTWSCPDEIIYSDKKMRLTDRHCRSSTDISSYFFDNNSSSSSLSININSNLSLLKYQISKVSIDELPQSKRHSSITISTLSSQIGVTSMDTNKDETWHYFLFGSEPTKLDVHVIRAIDVGKNSRKLIKKFPFVTKWYQVVQLRPAEEQNSWITPVRSTRKVLFGLSEEISARHIKRKITSISTPTLVSLSQTAERSTSPILNSEKRRRIKNE
ncbi:unnamed protein product [Didymodactylos carnosus]|uniref:ANKLE2 third alpha/beta domain-containing protein n=1 Tax=Didymodactylos carnosus TaxID=1234261 RepID=A0A813RAH3_9BILA|nr:unnamed protein product [Didymodactylos carnosus]CAF0781273.1 unnamed protein product [Didymodactylos carnosus]CAF3498656.1 unnamed protein product [Didymodactylos carnosus]CAF3564573.1 unnamed protein product [Didymodactylos carnosus]